MKFASPSGMPITVTQSSIPVTTWPAASQMPHSTSQIRLSSSRTGRTYLRDAQAADRLAATAAEGYNAGMSERPEEQRPETPVEGDEDRQHAQDPAEGPDEDAERRDDVPRVHPEDPAEG